jgi:hypothetical protein
MARLKRLIAVGTVALGLMAGASPALAQGNPHAMSNPYASISTAGRGGACITTFKAPPAYGDPLYRSPATGGNPGVVLNTDHGNRC